MADARRDGRYLVLLGIAMFLLIGMALENAAPVTTVDFKLVYYGARCLLENRDPYIPSNLDSIYRAEGGESAGDTLANRLSERRYNYPPTAFSITVPFAVLPFGVAHSLWLTLIAASVIVASCLMWEIAADTAPLLAGALVFLILADSDLFLILGNPAGIAVGLCVIAVWCFLRRRWETIGVLCLAVSLILKPHDGALVWLYFALAGGAYRKRAWQTLCLVAVLSLPAIIWVSIVAPNWLQEFRSILAIMSSHGDVNDPGPSSMAAHGIGMVISLQAVISVFRDDPRIYNPVTYVLVGALILVWIAKILRSSPTIDNVKLALAPIAALSVLPIYHRIYDARLLLLSVPACTLIWRKSAPWIGRIAVLLAAAAIFVTGAMPWAILLTLIKQRHWPASLSSPIFLTALQVFPAPLILLLSGCLFLWIFVRQPLSGIGRPHREPKKQLLDSALGI
jgi:hypothetical protein